VRIMRTPRSLDLLITGKCNLRCTYCSHFSSAGDTKEDLPTDAWLTFFEELNECAVLSVCLQGGEPLMRPDFVQLVEGIVRNRMRFSMLSNGTLITAELAAFLASTKRCNGVQLSIDGSTPGSHDVFRGEGSLSRAISGLRILLEHHVPVTVRVTIHKQNLADLENVMELLLRDVGLPSVSTNSAGYLGLCRRNSEIVQLTAEERREAMATLVRLAEKYKDRISATAGPLAEARIWSEMESARSAGLPSLPGGGKLTGCGGAVTKLAVTPDGAFVPCPQLPAIGLGKVNRDRLRDVWLHHPELHRFRHRSQISLDRFAFCRDCPYIRYCRGGCPATAYTMLGDSFHPSPDSCYRRFLEADGASSRKLALIAKA